jgi:hypothetical protein
MTFKSVDPVYENKMVSIPYQSNEILVKPYYKDLLNTRHDHNVGCLVGYLLLYVLHLYGVWKGFKL